ncbi:hypothetical protein OESDEN_03697, partial [Oesophagostomum dentatum]
MERQEHTERQINNLLNVLDVEVRPVETYRMALRNVYKIRNNADFNGIYLRRSMTADETEHDRQLRRKAKELNEKEGK